MQTLYFACTSDAIGKQDELQSNWLSNLINREMRCASVTPHTNSWDAQRDPTPERRGPATRGEAKRKIGPLSLFSRFSFSFLFSQSDLFAMLLLYIYR